jgi:hypothetical protein
MRQTIPKFPSRTDTHPTIKADKVKKKIPYRRSNTTSNKKLAHKAYLLGKMHIALNRVKQKYSRTLAHKVYSILRRRLLVVVTKKLSRTRAQRISWYQGILVATEIPRVYFFKKGGFEKNKKIALLKTGKVKSNLWLRDWWLYEFSLAPIKHKCKKLRDWWLYEFSLTPIEHKSKTRDKISGQYWSDLDRKWMENWNKYASSRLNNQSHIITVVCTAAPRTTRKRYLKATLRLKV